MLEKADPQTAAALKNKYVYTVSHRSEVLEIKSFANLDHLNEEDIKYLADVLTQDNYKGFLAEWLVMDNSAERLLLKFKGYSRALDNELKEILKIRDEYIQIMKRCSKS